jgi:glycosyltransferase involved in cell wall biosynthesis
VPAEPSAQHWPSVTVVVPTRDRPVLLATALAGIAAQDYPGQLDVVVVYDRTEPYDGVLEAAQVAVTGLVNDRSPGLAGTRNTGILAATGELVAFCDDDDCWLPGKLTRQVAAWREEPQTSLVTCGIQVRYGDDVVVDRVLTRTRIGVADLLRDRLTELHPSTFLMRRADVVERIGLVDEALPGGYAEDYDFLLRAAKCGPVVNVAAVGVMVLWHPQSFFDSRWETVSNALRALLRKHPEFARDRRGAARIHGQIAFAEAARRQRRAALRAAATTLRYNPAEPRTLLAAAVAVGVPSELVIRTLHKRGRGI